MATERAHDRALRELSDHLEAIGATVTGTIEEEVEGTSLDGFRCAYAGNDFALAGRPDLAYFQVQFEESVIPAVAKRLYFEDEVSEMDAESGRVTVQGHRSDLDFERARRSVVERWERKSPESRRKLEFSLLSKLAASGVGYSILKVDDGAIHGFKLHSKLFPHEDGFGASTLNDRVMNVIDNGIVSRRILSRAYGVSAPISTGDEGSALDPGRDRTFQ